MRTSGYGYQPETDAEIAKLPIGTIAKDSAFLGFRCHEPLLVAMDSMLRYAKAYRHQQGVPVSEDGVLGPAFLSSIDAIRALLNGDGAVAMERGITTDSKDNGVIEALYWRAREVGGFAEGD